MDLIDALCDLSKSKLSPIISIDGPAGAGKSTLASHLENSLKSHFSISLVHMDNLYNGWSDPFGQPFLNSLQRLTDSHTSGLGCEIPHYNWADRSYGASHPYSPAELLILEGVGSSSSLIRSKVTASIWVGISPEVGLERVLARDGDGISKEMKEWLVTQEAFFINEKSEELADFALTT
jgi:uridine kinase